jgi:Mn-dependent DtxR family transcriptional regulator
MTNKNNSLSSGLEDYIEAIYIAELNKVPLKGAELARKLNISRASVSEALSKLVSKGLITYESYGVITLTQKGEKEAEKVYSKHNILKNFFEQVLDVEPQEAAENACKIEHIVSDNLIKSIQNFMSEHAKTI